MPDSTIRLPAGLSGPRLRSANEQQVGDEVKAPYVVEDWPWRVDRSYEYMSLRYLISTDIIALANWPFLFGYPTGSPAGTAAVIRKLTVGIASDSAAAGSKLQLDLARASAPSGGVSSSADFLKMRTSYGSALATLVSGATATKGAVAYSLAHYSLSTHFDLPRKLLRRKWTPQNWFDAIVLIPGEYFGGKYENPPVAAATPNGVERVFLHICWDEVTL